MISPNKILTSCAPYTYIHVMHLTFYGRTLKHVWGEKRTPRQEHDRIPSTTPGAEPPRDAKDSGSARSHSTHLETSSSNRP